MRCCTGVRVDQTTASSCIWDDDRLVFDYSSDVYQLSTVGDIVVCVHFFLLQSWQRVELCIFSYFLEYNHDHSMWTFRDTPWNIKHGSIVIPFRMATFVWEPVSCWLEDGKTSISVGRHSAKEIKYNITAILADDIRTWLSVLVKGHVSTRFISICMALSVCLSACLCMHAQMPPLYLFDNRKISVLWRLDISFPVWHIATHSYTINIACFHPIVSWPEFIWKEISWICFSARLQLICNI